MNSGGSTGGKTKAKLKSGPAMLLTFNFFVVEFNLDVQAESFHLTRRSSLYQLSIVIGITFGDSRVVHIQGKYEENLKKLESEVSGQKKCCCMP